MNQPSPPPPPPATMTTPRPSWHPLNFTPEIILLLIRTGNWILEPAVPLYIVHCICAQMFQNVSMCNHIDIHPAEKLQVDGQSAVGIQMFKFLNRFPALPVLFLCGPWMEKVGHKLPILLPPVFLILAIMVLMMSTIPGIPVMACIYVASAIIGATGRTVVVRMALRSYVTHTTTVEERTPRMTRLISMNFFGTFLGTFGIGFVLGISNFTVLFSVAIFFNAAGFLYSVAFMNDDVPLKSEKLCLKEDNEDDVNKVTFYSVLCRPRKGWNRVYMWVLVIVFSIHLSLMFGEVDASLLFVQRHPFTLTSSGFGYLLALSYGVSGIMLILIPQAIKRFNIQCHDLTLVIIGLLFHCFRFIMHAFAYTNWHIYFLYTITAISAIPQSCIISIMSKIIEPEEHALMSAIISITETFAGFMGTLFMTTMYVYSEHIFPGLVFVVSAVFTFLLVIFLQVFASCTNWYGKNEQPLLPTSESRNGSITMTPVKKSDHNKE